MKEYWEILRELREDHDLKQSEVADILQIKRQVYSRYETGVNEMPIHHLKKICLFYHVSSDYILGLSPVQAINLDGPDPRDRPQGKR
ncbi:MAG: helix-turn-helix transcriptional regulator [Clostridia bacterium]|nr:helix-turn-helix transcriptional regulator [Clostridia bacterium]